MTESIEGVEATPERGLTRRQVALGAAWAAPVVALAVATPMAAASVTSADFSANIGVGGAATGSTPPTFNNVWTHPSTFTLSGPQSAPGDSTGQITVLIYPPVGYVLNSSNGASTPTPTGALSTGGGTLISTLGDVWTYTYNATEERFEFRNPGITIASGHTSGTIVFPPLVAVGNGAYYTSRNNRNNLEAAYSTAAFGSAGSNQYPGPVV